MAFVHMWTYHYWLNVEGVQCHQDLNLCNLRTCINTFCIVVFRANREASGNIMLQLPSGVQGVPGHLVGGDG